MHYSMKLFFVLLLYLELHFSCAETMRERKGSYSLTIHCENATDLCDFSAVDSITKKKFHKKIAVDLSAAGLIWHQNNLVELIQSFGTSDSYSKFFDFNSFEFSPNNFSDVIAVDPKRNIVAYCGNDEVFVKNIFLDSKAIFSIKRKFDGPPSISVSRAGSYYTKNGELLLDYVSTEHGKMESMRELIKVDNIDLTGGRRH